MKKTKVLLAGLLLSGIISSPVFAADPIEGTWKTEDGVLLGISSCGGQFCVDILNGEFEGKRSGKMQKDGDGYTGKLRQYSTGLTFTGEASISGSTMKLAAKKFGVVVRRATWKKQ